MTACGPDADIWGEDDNARLYDAFARQHPIYRDTSRDLIALARLSADAAVLDLACGTGVTSREAPAETIDRHVTGPVDAVVCNSAIWQTDLATTAAAVRNLLGAGGRFVFNTGADYLGQQQDPTSGTTSPPRSASCETSQPRTTARGCQIRPPRLAGGPGRPVNPSAAAWTASALTSSRSPSSHGVRWSP